ncbi:MraY family glycosyltransferase [Thermomonas sp.]|uniref:MraY family glycosyltransferase n=1 Tax=Thermomonas sp. TaxID=1971895 RepID=UPI00262B65A6|nr:MraY family glycosyltransferase [Thermomonas sp.]
MLKGFDPVAAILAFLITAGVMCLLRPVAHRLDLLDHPQGRKDHAAPTPVTGGLAIFIGCVAAFFLFQSSASDGLRAFSAAALLLVVVGLWDDMRDVRWYWRILAQVVAALIIIFWGGVRVEQIGPVFGLPELSLGWLSVPFTVFATVGIINAMNMIDGADGQAGLLGLAALAMLMMASLYAGNTLLAERVSVLAGGLAGFLIWNLRLPWRPRASAFLGNAGSALLGLVIAWVSFRLTQNPGHPVNPVLALWLLPIPVMDCLVVSVRRMRQGRSPFFADRSHIHHILQDAGFGPTRAALHLTWFSLLCGLAVGQAMRMDVPNPVLLALFVLLCLGWYALTSRRERAVALFSRLRRAHPAPARAEIEPQAAPVPERSDRSA